MTTNTTTTMMDAGQSQLPFQKEENDKEEEIVYISIYNNNLNNETPPQQQQQLQVPFYHDRHVTYIQTLVQTLDQNTSYEGAVTEHLRMSGIYWSWMALALLTPPHVQLPSLMIKTKNENSDNTNNNDNNYDDIVDWVMACYDPKTGGFGGNIGQDAHILYTLSAIQILAMANRLGNNNEENDHQQQQQLDVNAITQFIASLQQEEDGSFCGEIIHHWTIEDEEDNDIVADTTTRSRLRTRRSVGGGGEVDTRFTYCALCALALLHPNQSLDQYVNVRKAAEYVVSCQNQDGGFGSVRGAESHAGQVFCCIGALAIAKSLDLLLISSSSLLLSSPLERLAWWLSERQVDSGGLNGRSEKQADVCYSFWILTAMCILGRMSWIHRDKLAHFILLCQDEIDGGIADRPDDMPDVFHTFFGIAGLSLLGHLHQQQELQQQQQDSSLSTTTSTTTTSNKTRRLYRKIDPIFALPTDVVERMGLSSAQVMAPLRKGDVSDDRLHRYQVLPPPPPY